MRRKNANSLLFSPLPSLLTHKANVLHTLGSESAWVCHVLVTCVVGYCTGDMSTNAEIKGLHSAEVASHQAVPCSIPCVPEIFSEENLSMLQGLINGVGWRKVA